ncbi:hypothetical protein [Gimesia maris]|uniref:hypothetical protein n=1 Tax=Gimesia maris TaxID=122 RepID=UPI002420059B|nr:hypothetical protein [Gimesia maris]|tara:strand:+ start:23506 stop:23709 length:204 start_codon:yes stop_codon:yes gene_type:complete
MLRGPAASRLCRAGASAVCRGFDGVPFESDDGAETFLQGKTLFSDYQLKQQFQYQDQTLDIEVPAGK